MYRKRIEIAGAKYNKDKLDYYLKSDIFVFPSYYGEGLPTVLIEAMAVGLPIVTTKVGAITYIMKNGVNGVILDDHSSKSIVAGIEQLLENPQKMDRMKRHNLENAEQYDVQVVTRKMEQYYREILCRNYYA
ncbi:unnamed protein product [marine sediment metagenome]|uniref:Glycosyl transferase family 1 domain-containing protein n=1 Tax=marine sediment metagenome TaxID=412755 RepID=X1HMG7_9ZZZZ